MHTENIKQLEAAVAPLKAEIIHHPLYKQINSIDDLNIFMQYHVYAVWDFMSLLKALQRNLTCITLPWQPVGDGETRYLINEIVTGEESDVDQFGNRKSHYELYLEAMQQSKADTGGIIAWTQALRSGKPVLTLLQTAELPEKIKKFLNHTFSIIDRNQPFEQSAVFTFGREDLIPDMFLSIIRDLNAQFPERISIFNYYLERHIEVDGDHHSHLALEMTSKLCGDSPEKWQIATESVKEALQMRIQLWDGALEEIKKRH